MTKLYPTQDRLVVEMDDRETESAGGIVFSDITIAQNKPEWGTVMAAGPDCQHCVMDDKVYIPTTLGTVMKLGGKEVVIVREAQVLAKR